MMLVVLFHEPQHRSQRDMDRHAASPLELLDDQAAVFSRCQNPFDGIRPGQPQRDQNCLRAISFMASLRHCEGATTETARFPRSAPRPKPHIRTVSPDRMRPAREASSSTNGIEPAEVFP